MRATDSRTLSLAIVLAIVLASVAPAARADGAEPRPEEDDGLEVPFESPRSVHGELDAARTQMARFPLPTALHDSLEPWYEWKARVLADTGLDFAFSYAALYQRASRSHAGGNRDGAGGIFRFLGSWTLVERGTENEGALVYRVEQRHKLGTDLAPTEVGPATGSITKTGRTFSDFQWGATLAFWRMDGRDDADLPHNWGLNISASIEDDSGFMPFLRAGYASGETATLDRVVTIGAGQRVCGHDMLGAGVSWGRPTDRDLDDQGTAEVFYRIQLAENLQLTPDLQLIINPALDPGENTLWVAGLRLRITF